MNGFLLLVIDLAPVLMIDRIETGPEIDILEVVHHAGNMSFMDYFFNPFILHFFHILKSICVASLQNSPLVGRNESGIIHDLSKNIFFNFSLFCLMISILINIVF